jgi:hypothetical protein
LVDIKKILLSDNFNINALIDLAKHKLANLHQELDQDQKDGMVETIRHCLEMNQMDKVRQFTKSFNI